MTLEENITLLEKEASGLELSAEQWLGLQDATQDYAWRLVKGLSTAKTYGYRDPATETFTKHPIQEEGRPIQQLLELLRTEVDSLGINPASGGFMGYIPGGGLAHSAFGDLLAALSNRYSSVFFSAPGAVRMENMLIQWMAAVVGYPESSGGYLASGGSIANLSAIVTAREAFAIDPTEVERSVIYLTSQTHHCVDKALRIAGLASCPKRLVEVDSAYRMMPESLEANVAEDRRQGLRPWLIIASAGTTNTGSVDPLTDIEAVARQNELWLHVDGAYGAFFALCQEGKAILQGMDKSDSIVLDPHKSLFLPYGTGALVVKDKPALIQAHGGMADYMRDAVHSNIDVSPARMSPELTKHFRALRMWLPLMAHGLAPFRAALSEKILLARYAYDQIQSMNRFELGPYPDLSVVTFRYVPKAGDADDFNSRLTRAIQIDGRVFLSSTKLRGTVYLRIAIGSFRTHRRHIDLALEVLQETASDLSAG